jgi:hypothetical protein
MSAGDLRFTPEEASLMGDQTFFPAKAQIMAKVRALLEQLHRELQEEISGTTLLTPDGFNPGACQFVKGEHLEDFPYQYLDFPKHFAGDDKFTFRSLFWWGHHFVFALILEGGEVARYKQNLINRFSDMAGRGVCLGLGPSLWEWKRGSGYTLELTKTRKSELAAVLSGRRSFKLARFLALDDPAVRDGRLLEVARASFRSFLPVITP